MGVARIAPDYIPPIIGRFVSPILFVPTHVPVVLPAPATPTLETAITAASPATLELPSETPTMQPTKTLPPVIDSTATPVTSIVPPPGGDMGQIAFASARSGIPQIYMININGTGLQPITKMDGGACQPSWSPDGSQLVFISPCKARSEFFENTYTGSGLYSINADSTELKPLSTAPGSDFDPAWSPDGRRIAFTSLRDGKKDIYLLAMDTGEVTRLTNATEGIQGNSQPAWSHFGNQLAYTVKRFNAYQVWAMSDTGQKNVQLAHSGQELWDYLPTWRPDGKTIIFNERNLGPSLPWLMSIRYEDRDTKAPTKLGLQPPIEDVEFSPDGLWVVFESADEKGNRDIYFSTSTGGDLTRLTNDPADEFDPTWRPIQKNVTSITSLRFSRFGGGIETLLGSR